MRNTYYILYFIIATYLFVSSCSKETTTIDIDYSAPIINTINALQQNDDAFILTAEILQVNDIEILEHGFTIQRQISNLQYDTEQLIKINSKAVVGIIETHWKSITKLKEGDKFRYYYYIKTKKGFYKSAAKEILINNIKLTTATISAVINESVTLKGDFSALDPTLYKIYTSDSKTSIPFHLNANKNQLSFRIAESTEAIHGSTINYILQSKYDQVGNSLKILATIKILAVLNMPYKTAYRYTNTLELKGLGIPKDDNPNTNLLVLINDYKIPYKKVIRFTDIADYNAENFRLGYFNGRDTIWFNQQYNMIIPKPEDIIYNKTRIHTHTGFVIKGFEFEFRNPETVKHMLGNYNLQHAYTYFDEFTCYVKDIPDGTYTYKYISDVYTIHSSNTITVNALQVNTPEKRDYYIGETIPLSGNFIKGQEYYVKSNINGLYQSFTCKEEGILNPELQTAEEGNVDVYIGYPIWEGTYFPNKITVTNKGATLDYFSPVKGYQGQLITIRGKGVHLAKSILIGNISIDYNIERKPNEIKFILPNTNNKGPVELGLFINNKYYKFDKSFEII